MSSRPSEAIPRLAPHPRWELRSSHATLNRWSDAALPNTLTPGDVITMLSLKLLLRIAVPLLLIVAAFVLGWICARRTPQVPPVTFHAGLSIDRITELAELLVVQLEVTDVVVTSLQGRTGGVQGCCWSRGTFPWVSTSRQRGSRTSTAGSGRPYSVCQPPLPPARGWTMHEHGSY
jgi:hypothetical protein